MIRESLTIQFKAESGNEDLNAELFMENIPAPKFPRSVSGKFTDATERQIIQYELAPDDVVVWFKTRKYRFQSLNREGDFTIVRCW